MLKNKIGRLLQSPMLRNVTKISSGTMLGQLVSIVTLPIYTRIYGPTVIGNWTLFSSVAIIVNTFSDLGLSNAIMMEDDGEECNKLFSVITTLVSIISVLVGVFYYFIYLLNPDESGIHPLFYAIVLSVLIYTQQQVNLCYNWLNKKREYSILMKNPIINNLSVAVVAVPLGFMGFIKYGYYIGLIAGQLITLIHMRRFLPKIFFNVNIKDHVDVLKKHKEYVKYQMPTYMIAQIKNQSPVFLLRSFFGAEVLGYYSVCTRVLQIPLNLLASAIGRVYYQTAADMVKRGEPIGEFTFRNIKRAMNVAIFPMVVIMGIGDLVCVYFLGQDYTMSGNLVRIIVFMTFFQFLMSATQGITIVLHKQHYALVSGVVQIIGYVVGLTIGKVLFDSVYISCALMTIVFCTVQIIYFSKLFNAAGVNPKRYVKSVLFSLAIILLATVVIRFILLSFGVVGSI